MKFLLKGMRKFGGLKTRLQNFITPCIKFNGCALKAFKVNFSYLTVPQNPGPIQRNDESGRNGAFIGCMINIKIPEYYK